MLSFSNQGVLRAFDSRSGHELAAIDLQGSLDCVPVVSPDGKNALYEADGGVLNLVQLPTGRLVKAHGTFVDRVYRVAYVQHGERIAVAHGDGVSLVDAATSAVESLVRTSERVWRIRVSKDSSRVLIAIGAAAQLYDVSKRALLAEYRGAPETPGRDPIYDCALSPDGRMVATANFGGTIRLWNAATGEPMPSPAKAVGRAVAFSADSQRLAVGLSSIVIWDLKTLQEVAELEGHPGTLIDTLSFDATGERIVSAGWDDHLAKIWHVAGTSPPIVLRGHTNRLMTAEFSEDGRLVATGAFDNRARIWDAASGVNLRTIEGPIHAVSFSPDGSHLATGIGNGMVTWDVRVDGRPGAVMAGEIDRWAPWRLAEGELVADPWPGRFSLVAQGLQFLGFH
jgi:WD40 repeat protein